ncbi:MAG: rod shape-determining protein MreD [Selenomonadaceae bacterium]|nr:rod shape-determining protein MreD [Selenomonadaceae bacterium]
MRVIVLWALVIVLCYSLQTSLLSFINVNGFSANLMLLMTVSIAIMRGHRFGVFFGFIVGLLQDLTSGNFFGLATFSYMTIALLFGNFSSNLFREQALLPVISAVPALALHYLITIVFLFLLGFPIDLVNFIRNDFWPPAIMQVILAWPMHRIVYLLCEYSKENFNLF